MRDRIEHLLAELALQCPELAPALARLHMTTATPEELSRASGGMTTVATINRNGVGQISGELVEERPALARMVLAHEALHLVAERVARIDTLAGPAWDGDYRRANTALDRWINQLIVDMAVCSAADVQTLGGALPQAGMEEADLLDIWRAEPKAQKNAGAAMNGCAPGDDEEEGGGEGETPSQGGERQQEAHSVLAGLASYSPSLRKMVSPPPPTVRWQDVLHEAAAAARGAGQSARPRQTRAKWGRRSSDDIPKPGISARKPQLVVIVDISGSMSGLLDEVVAETEALSSQAGIRLVLHDAKVLFSGEYKKGRDRISPAGGTDFSPAIAESTRHAREWPGRSVVIHLTDGFPCGNWPDVPGDFAAGFCGIFGGYDVSAPGRWRTRHCGPTGKSRR